MYSIRPNLSIGFHGCDELVRNELVNKPNIVRKSQEVFDWLGNGFYIWENNYNRAYKWALDKKARNTLEKPAVLGVVYQLGYCLDFTDSEFIDILALYYELMKNYLEISGKEIPKNKNVARDKYNDLIFRELDCAVIEYLHQKIEEKICNESIEKGYSDYRRFDSVRGLFTEGGPAFEGAGIQLKNHIQVCIRNLNCIKGFFIPRKEVKFP